MEEMELTLTDEEFTSLQNRLRYEAENRKDLIYEKLTEQKNLQIPVGDRILLPLETFLLTMLNKFNADYLANWVNYAVSAAELTLQKERCNAIIFALERVKDGICVELVKPVAELIFEMWDDFFKDK